MAYCVATDLVYGDVQLPSGLSTSKFINDAADEIDSKIGFRYQTPITSAPRPVTLLLKRLNSHLASGRLILAADSAGQDSQLHAYGAYLVREATRTLNMIADGTLILPLDPDPTMPVYGKGIPLIANVDAVSQVEAFYDSLTDPRFTTSFPSPYRAAGG